MLFWVVVIAMMAAAVLFVLVPMARSKTAAPVQGRSLEVYKAQLRELEQRSPQTDAERAAIEDERVEIARRLLRADQAIADGDGDERKTSQRLVKWSSVATLVALPVLGFALYGTLGSPGKPDAPLSARAAEPLEDKSVAEMVQIAEKHLAKNPDDARGWEVLANVYGRMNRPVDRARAFRELIRLRGESPVLLAELAESLTVANGNIVSAQAAELFKRAAQGPEGSIKAGAYLAMADEQEGNLQAALDRWKALSARRPGDETWSAMTRARMGALEMRMADQPGPTQEQVDAAADLSEEQRREMIVAMVDGLASRLETSPDDFEGWKRLVRSQAVLKNKHAAADALSKAMAQFSGQAEKMSQLREMAKQFNLTEGVQP